MHVEGNKLHISTWIILLDGKFSELKKVFSSTFKRYSFSYPCQVEYFSGELPFTYVYFTTFFYGDSFNQEESLITLEIKEEIKSSFERPWDFPHVSPDLVMYLTMDNGIQEIWQELLANQTFEVKRISLKGQMLFVLHENTRKQEDAD